MKIYAKLIACLLLHFAGPGLAAEAAPPVLRFPDGISWKAVFDAGFRPKHILGLKRKMTDCRDQPLRFEWEGEHRTFHPRSRAPVDRVEAGRQRETVHAHQSRSEQHGRGGEAFDDLPENLWKAPDPEGLDAAGDG